MLLSQEGLAAFLCLRMWQLPENLLLDWMLFSVHHQPTAHALPASLEKHEYEWIIEIPLGAVHLILNSEWHYTTAGTGKRLIKTADT